MQQDFTKILMRWGEDVERNMPWKATDDPYAIWLSEIILQQTRVEQGKPYYIKFIETYPDIKSLAKAPEDEIMKLWQGLGYYSRARNMHAAAKYVVHELGGHFPDDLDSIKGLKGVGDYTAAAIASFAFNLPHAVVDGNVYRVLARYFGIHTPIDSTAGKKEFKALADQLVPKDNPGAYNQAIMDFGALQCSPGRPNCEDCPLNAGCVAYKRDVVTELPVKQKRIKQKHRYFHYIVIDDGEHLYLNKREEKDIWRNLYDFPMVEADKRLTFSNLIEEPLWGDLLGKSAYQHDKTPIELKQTLTHQKINGLFFEVSIKGTYHPGISGLVAVKKENLNNFAFPKLINCYLEDKILYSNIT